MSSHPNKRHSGPPSVSPESAETNILYIYVYNRRSDIGKTNFEITERLFGANHTPSHSHHPHTHPHSHYPNHPHTHGHHHHHIHGHTHLPSGIPSNTYTPTIPPDNELDSIDELNQNVEQFNFTSPTPHITVYTRFHLEGVLQLMGCKPLHSVDIAEEVFQFLQRSTLMTSNTDVPGVSVPSSSHTAPTPGPMPSFGPSSVTNNLRSLSASWVSSTSAPKFSRHVFVTKNSEVTLERSEFLSLVATVLESGRAASVRAHSILDFAIACDLHERNINFPILLAGTSGSGKSTLSSLLASRLGISTVISTDHIRHMMRTFIGKDQSPVLWSSTYQAYEYLKFPENTKDKEKIVAGWEAQNEVIFDKVLNMISKQVGRKEPFIVEGAHLSIPRIIKILEKFPTCLPFLIYISNEAKHIERFAIRAKYMTIDPHHNKYTRYIKSIRVISDRLRKDADIHLIPKIDNTNVDRSIAAIHATILGAIRRHLQGEQVFKSKKTLLLHEEYVRIQGPWWSSKGMFQHIINSKLKQEQAEQGVEQEVQSDSDSDSGQDYADYDDFDPNSLGS